MNISMRTEGLADAMMGATSATKAGEEIKMGRGTDRWVGGPEDERIQQPPPSPSLPCAPGQLMVSVLLISFHWH